LRRVAARFFSSGREIPGFRSQILSIVLASLPTMPTVLAGILINSSRLGDVNSRLDGLRSNVDSRIK
jgi:hypothetical protein